MKRTAELYAQDILENINDAEVFLEGFTYEQFFNDKKTKYAVVRALEIIGEAAKNIPPHIKKEYSEIVWKDITGMRNRIAHEYFGINYTVVWHTVHNELPPLKNVIQHMLDNHASGAISLEFEK